jgi:hypothetical protein
MLQMKIVNATVLSVLLAAATSSAQQTAVASDPAALHRGTMKMWIGASLIGAGAFLIPVTAATNDSRGPITRNAGVGLGLMAGGSCMMWWGAQQRRRATQPEITLGVALGRNTGVHIRRAW